MIKLEIISKGSLFHYAHFLCDVLFCEIYHKTYLHKEVIRLKTIQQTIGNFSHIYEEVMGNRNIELSKDEYQQISGEVIKLKRTVSSPIEQFNAFREYMFKRYNIERDERYPEVILIERGNRVELLNDERLKKDNKNFTNGKERREITKIDELKKYLKNKFNDNFKVLILENIQFNEQIKYFFNARFIIAMHGAALSNLLFSNQGTNVLEITAERTFPFFDEITSTLKINHYKCENDLIKIKNEIDVILQQQVFTNETIMDNVIQLIQEKKLEISKIKGKILVPSIFYIGMEKAASKSILKGFPENIVAHWHSLEYFEQIYESNLLSSHNLDLYDLAIYIGRKYKFKPLIVESIREPISQILSAIMQHFKRYGLENCGCDFCKYKDNREGLLEIIKSKIGVDYWINFPTKGFQSIKLWNKHFGIDLLKVFQKKNCYYDIPMVKILLIRLEDSHERARLFEKIGYDYEETFSNKTEDNEKVSDLYEYINNNISFTEEELDKIYSNEVKILYNQTEINEFKKKWIKQNNPPLTPTGQ